MRWSLLGWCALGVYLSLAAFDFYRLFWPDLRPTFPTEHVFHPAWIATNPAASTAAAPKYAWMSCVSSSAREISQEEMREQACLFVKRAIMLGADTDERVNASLPARLLQPFVQRQAEYQRAHSEYAEASELLEQAKKAKREADAASKQGRAKDPSDLAPGSGISNLSGALLRFDAARDALVKAKVALLKHELHLHSFIWRADSAAGPLQDPLHVHTSTPLLERWIVPVNASRNLLSGDASKLEQNASSHFTGMKGSTQLIYHFRPHLAFHFMSSPLSFPLSSVPPDLAPSFPRRRGGSSTLAREYGPIVVPRELLTMRRQWIGLNESIVEEATKMEAQAAAQPSEPKEIGGEKVFTTNATNKAGVSDEEAKVHAQEKASSAVPSPPLSYTSSGFTLHLSLSGVSLGWHRLLAQLEQSSALIASVGGMVEKMQEEGGRMVEERTQGGGKEARLHKERLAHAKLNEDSGSEMEEIKTLFVDTNPWLLLLTFVVSLLHLLFDFLSMKNDIKFWRERKNFTGISARSVWITSAVRTVLFLYLIDQETSKLVLVSMAFSLLIGYWKSFKLMRVTFELTKSFPYIMTFAPQPKSESKTEEYDTMAMKTCGWISLPFIIGASAYSLLYQEHKSYYSWILTSFATAVYTGGFVLMTPQLFINYKLKSVAHLDFKVFVYRACNTFIDDLFAFIVPMPILHRLACFRDDIIFFIYLYQRWIYPVDHTRTLKLDDDEDGAPPSATELNPLVDAAATATDASASSEDVAPVSSSASNAGQSDDSTADTDSTLTRRHQAVQRGTSPSS